MEIKKLIIGILILLFLILAIRKFLLNSTKRRYKRQHKKWRRWQKKTERKAERELQRKQIIQGYHARKAHKEWEKQQRKVGPDPNEKFVDNPDWIWDEENRMWRHKKYWDKVNQGKD